MKQKLKSLVKKTPIVGPICKFLNRVFLQLRKPFLVPSSPVTEDVSDRIVRLPFYTSMSEEKQGRVIEAVLKFKR